MKVYYDAEADVLCFRLSDAPIDEGDEIESGGSLAMTLGAAS
jgi:uncharacterized protein YuzE